MLAAMAAGASRTEQVPVEKEDAEPQEHVAEHERSFCRTALCSPVLSPSLAAAHRGSLHTSWLLFEPRCLQLPVITRDVRLLMTLHNKRIAINTTIPSRVRARWHGS